MDRLDQTFMGRWMPLSFSRAAISPSLFFSFFLKTKTLAISLRSNRNFIGVKKEIRITKVFFYKWAMKNGEKLRREIYYLKCCGKRREHWEIIYWSNKWFNLLLLTIISFLSRVSFIFVISSCIEFIFIQFIASFHVITSIYTVTYTVLYALA